MKRSTQRILTTHIGSMARPPELLKHLTARNSGEAIDEKVFDPLVRATVADVVKKQVEAGIDVVNDGEQSKIGFASYLKDRLGGFEFVPQESQSRHTFLGEAEDFPEFYARGSTVANEGVRRRSRQGCCVGPIAWKDFSQVERDIENLKSAIAGQKVEQAFMSSLSPSLAARFQPNKFYKTNEEYVYAIGDAIKREYKAIVDAGFVLQVDLPIGSTRTRPVAPGQTAEQAFAEFRKELAANIEALNYALADIPEDMVRMHVCFGSDPGPHNRDPDLASILDLLFKVKAGGITLVCSSGRHEHEWKIWQDRKLPEGKTLIVGVIDHTSNIIEHPETVADRIVRWAGVVGRENVIAGVDCGFDPSAGVEETRVDRRIMWAKLRSLSEGARLATKELWGKAP